MKLWLCLKYYWFVFFRTRCIYLNGWYIAAAGSLPYNRQPGNSTVVVMHSSTGNANRSETDRDTESITLDQFLDECNKSPKSRVCSRQMAGFCIEHCITESLLWKTLFLALHTYYMDSVGCKQIWLPICMLLAKNRYSFCKHFQKIKFTPNCAFV